jgi:DDE superfamily endonuclease
MTKPEMGAHLIERAAGWDVPVAPVLGDSAYGDNTVLRERLHDLQLEYVLSVAAQTTVFTAETSFIVGECKKGGGRPPSRARPDRKPQSIACLVAECGTQQLVSVTFRDGPDGTQVTSRFAFLRVRAGNRFGGRVPWPPREEWLIAEWPEGRERPTDSLDLQPARGHPARAAGAPGAAALEDRAGLHATQGRTRP